MPNQGSNRFLPDPDAWERDAQIVRDRTAGMTWTELAEKYGRNKGTLYHRYREALQRVIEPAVSEHRAKDLATIEWLIEQQVEIINRRHPAIAPNGQVVDGAVDDGPRIQAMNTLLKTLDRKARLLGEDAPSKAVVQVIPGDLVEQRIKELEAQVVVMGELTDGDTTED